MSHKMDYPAAVNSLVLIGAAAFPDDVRKNMRQRADSARSEGMATVL